jgi:hypothetical protein
MIPAFSQELGFDFEAGASVISSLRVELLHGSRISFRFSFTAQ